MATELIISSNDGEDHERLLTRMWAFNDNSMRDRLLYGLLELLAETGNVDKLLRDAGVLRPGEILIKKGAK